MSSSLPLAVASVVASLGPSLAAPQFTPNHVFVTSAGNDRVLEFDATGALVREIGVGSGLATPQGLAFGPDGNLYVASRDNDRVLVFEAGGSKVDEIGAGFLGRPHGLAFGPEGHLFVACLDESRVAEFDGAGDFVNEIQDSALIGPGGVVAGSGGRLFVSSVHNDRVVEFDVAGAQVREIAVGSGLGAPFGIAMGRNEHLFVASQETDSVFELDGAGAKVKEIPIGPNGPTYLAFGPDGGLYVSPNLAETDVQRVLVFDPLLGTAIGELGAGTSLLFPTGIAFAPFRFEASVTGTIAISGTSTKTGHAKGVLSIAPGSHQAMLRIVDDPLAAGDLASVFGETCFVFQGFQQFAAAADKKRLVHGVQVGRAERGIASLGLALAGKLDPSGAYVVKKCTGALERSAAAGAFLGKVTAAKLLK